MRTCRVCKRNSEEDGVRFRVYKKGTNTYQSHVCRECTNDAAREYFHVNYHARREMILKRNRLWYARNRVKRLKQIKKRYRRKVEVWM